MALTYPDYLKIDELLSIQIPKSEPAEHDEMLFIVIHQVYELWFKLLLHEIEKANRDLSAGNLFDVIATIKRMRTVMKTLVGQVDILETMTPMNFTSFRNRLETASGFQSFQFRELEFLLGQKRQEVLKYYTGDVAHYPLIDKRMREPSMIDHFYRFLARQGEHVPDELLNRDVTEPNPENDEVQEILFKLYKSRPDIAILLELMTDFDEGLQEWRYRHVKLVERTIGNKRGTGGTLGVEFLKRSLFHPVFPDLWAIRHRL